MRTCIAATRKVSHVFIYKYVYKVSGAHAPLGPTVDTPLSLNKAAEVATTDLEVLDILCGESLHTSNTELYNCGASYNSEAFNDDGLWIWRNFQLVKSAILLINVWQRGNVA